MALRALKTKRFKNIKWQSGHIYKFSYLPWQNDPKPVILLINAYDGIHPNTGHQWRFFQGINFTYIPRGDRRRFAARWVEEWERSNSNFDLTWNTLIREYPYLKNGIRRYFFKPAYYISNVVEVPLEDIEDVIVSTWSRDFSKKIRSSLAQKFRRVIGRRR